MQCRKRLPPAACARAQAVPSVSTHARCRQAEHSSRDARRTLAQADDAFQKTKLRELILVNIIMFFVTGVLFKGSKWALDEPTKVLEVDAAALQSSGLLESNLHIDQEHNSDGLKPHVVAEGLWAAGLPAPFAAVT